MATGTALALLTLFAALVRWPYLLLVPHLTDETIEVRWALGIGPGNWPLTAFDAYYGPAHAYLLAGAFWLFGLHPLLPRFVVFLFGCATVPLVALLGTRMVDRRVGLAAGALLATAPVHVIVNSHLAWQNATTPLYTTACALAALNGVAAWRAGRTGWLPLLLAGGLLGLAVQSHPGTLLFAPALSITLLWELGRAWWVARAAHRAGAARIPIGRICGALVLASATALLAYAPVLAHNVRHGFDGVATVRGQRTYAFERSPSWATYRHNVTELGWELCRLVSDPFRIPLRPLDHLTSPHLLVAVAIVVLGVVLLARRNAVLPLAALLCIVGVLPWFNHAYGAAGPRIEQTGDPLATRYIAYLLPLAALAGATALVAVADGCARSVAWGCRWRARRRSEDAALAARDHAVGRTKGQMLLLVPLLAAVLVPLIPLARYQATAETRYPANATYFALLDAIGDLTPGSSVALDGALRHVAVRDGTNALDVLEYLLTLDGVAHQTVDNPVARPGVPLFLVTNRARCRTLMSALSLQRLGLVHPLAGAPEGVALYRVGPPTAPVVSGAPPSGC